MRYAITMMLGALLAISSAGWSDSSSAIFEKGPSKAELKAKNKKGENWEGPHVPELTKMAQWEEAIAQSHEEPVIVFKHSTRCPICARAAYRVNQWLEEKGDEAPQFYLVKVIESRPISNKITEEMKVKHESPQVLLIQKGESLWDTSHDAITAEAIEAALSKHVPEEDAEDGA